MAIFTSDQLLDVFPNSRKVGIVRTLSAGAVEAATHVVCFQPSDAEASGLDGIFLVKTGSNEWATAQEDRAHLLAEGDLPPTWPRFQMRSRPLNGQAAVAYTIDPAAIMRVQTLGELLRHDDHTFTTVRAHLRRLLHSWTDWQSQDRVAPAATSLTALLDSTTHHGQPRHTLQRLALLLPFWDHGPPAIGVRGHDGVLVLPNPLPYLGGKSFERDVTVARPVGHLHGSLYAENVLCYPGSERPPLLLDFSAYEGHGNPLFDLASLELDLLLRVLPIETPKQREQWLTMLEFLMAGVARKSEPAGYYPAKAWLVLREIRSHVKKLLTLLLAAGARGDRDASRDVETVWWASVVAAGLMAVRRRSISGSPLESAAALLYTAFGLKRVREATADVAVEPGDLAYVQWVAGDLRAQQSTGLVANRHHTPEQIPGYVVRVPRVDEALHGLQSRWPVVEVIGSPGTGKTTLASYVANECLHMPRGFEASVWISTAEQLPHAGQFPALLDSIARQLDYPYVTTMDPASKREAINQLLCKRRTLIVIDDLDTADEGELDEWLDTIPYPSKALVTARAEGRTRMALRVALDGLDTSQARALIEGYCDKYHLPSARKALIGDLSHLMELTRGNPQVLTMTLGYIESHPKTWRQELAAAATAEHGDHPTPEALFELIWRDLDPTSRNVLLVLSFFAEGGRRSTISQIMAQLSVESHATEVALTILEKCSLLDVSATGAAAEARIALQPLIRACTTTKLQSLRFWEREAREAWVNWYQAFTDRYGGLDWQNWAEQFDRLEDEWANLLALFDWCAQDKSDDGYQALKVFWLTRVHRFADIYGYWSDRRHWLSWLRQAAEARGDHATEVHATMCLVWTLLQSGQDGELGAVQALNDFAWDRRHDAPAFVQSELVNNYILYSIRCGQLDQARAWIETMDDIVRRGALEERIAARQGIWIPFYRALVCSREGRVDLAEEYCAQVLAQAREIGWERQIVWALHLMGSIALAHQQYEVAGRYLRDGLEHARRNNDRRPVALFRRLLARMELTLQHWDAARQHATEALDLFERLGMSQQAETVAQYLAASYHHEDRVMFVLPAVPLDTHVPGWLT